MIASLLAAGSTSRFPSFTFLSKEVDFETYICRERSLTALAGRGGAVQGAEAMLG
jgi:hypothetical protein